MKSIFTLVFGFGFGFGLTLVICISSTTAAPVIGAVVGPGQNYSGHEKEGHGGAGELKEANGTSGEVSAPGQEKGQGQGAKSQKKRDGGAGIYSVGQVTGGMIVGMGGDVSAFGGEPGPGIGFVNGVDVRTDTGNVIGFGTGGASRNQVLFTGFPGSGSSGLTSIGDVSSGTFIGIGGSSTPEKTWAPASRPEKISVSASAPVSAPVSSSSSTGTHLVIMNDQDVSGREENTYLDVEIEKRMKKL